MGRGSSPLCFFGIFNYTGAERLWASGAQKCDTQWHSYVERAATIKTFSSDARGSDYANATGCVSPPRHQVARRVIIMLHFCPVVLQRRPSLSKIFAQSFRLSFVNMRSDSSSSPPLPRPLRCACAKLFRDSLITSDGIYNYVGKFWRTLLD